MIRNIKSLAMVTLCLSCAGMLGACTGDSGGSADAGPPKAGDSCATENTGICDGDRAELICQNGTRASVPCKGTRGCSESSTLIVCDESGNVAGDACEAQDNGTSICSADGSKQLFCTNGTRTATDCAGGCTTSGAVVTCALVDPNSTWDVVAASATFQTTTENGDSWDIGGGAPDGMLCWYDDINQSARTCTPEAPDSFSATWTTTLKAGVSASSLMNSASLGVLCLLDVDATSDDQAGCVYARFTAEEIHSGQTTMTLLLDGNNLGNASFSIRFVQR